MIGDLKPATTKNVWKKQNQKTQPQHRFKRAS